MIEANRENCGVLLNTQDLVDGVDPFFITCKMLDYTIVFHFRFMLSSVVNVIVCEKSTHELKKVEILTPVTSVHVLRFGNYSRSRGSRRDSYVMSRTSHDLQNHYPCPGLVSVIVIIIAKTGSFMTAFLWRVGNDGSQTCIHQLPIVFRLPMYSVTNISSD